MIQMTFMSVTFRDLCQYFRAPSVQKTLWQVCSCYLTLGVRQWFLTWGKLTPGGNIIFQGGKFTEP